jgi:hypothetical protein
MINKACSSSFRLCSTSLRLEGLSPTIPSYDVEGTIFVCSLHIKKQIEKSLIMGEHSCHGKSSGSCYGFLFSSIAFLISLWIFSPHLSPFVCSILLTYFINCIREISCMSSIFTTLMDLACQVSSLIYNLKNFCSIVFKHSVTHLISSLCLTTIIVTIP